MTDLTDAGEASKAIARLISQMPTIVAAFFRLRNGQEPVAPRKDLSHAANFLYMLDGEEPHPTLAKTMDVALILHMEHTMNASTFTGRVVASTMADPYAVVSSAIGSLTGPLHGGANERALANLRTIPGLESVDEVIGGKIERKEKIMGLGHRVYKTKDPRATILQGLVEAVFEVKEVPQYTRLRNAWSTSPPNVGPQRDLRTWTFTVVSSTTAWVFLRTCSPIFAIACGGMAGSLKARSWKSDFPANPDLHRRS